MTRRERPPIIHQLPEYASEGYPPSYEYTLPAAIEPSTLAVLHPWLREIASRDPDDAHATLEARWNGLQNDSLLQMRDYLLDCRPSSLVLTGAGGWLSCVDRRGGINLVSPPLDGDAIDQQRSRWHLENSPLLADLLTNFGGLREDFAPGGGYFIDDQNWEGVTESWMEAIEGHSEWKDALIIFTSRGGDKLLLDRRGRVGWWVADEVRMREAYRNLDACLLDFVRYRRVPWPFDPYEPRLDFPRVFG